MLHKLRALRRNFGFSQETVAKKIGVSHQLFSRIERAEVPLTYYKAVLIARVFNTTPDQMFLKDISATILKNK